MREGRHNMRIWEVVRVILGTLLVITIFASPMTAALFIVEAEGPIDMSEINWWPIAVLVSGLLGLLGGVMWGTIMKGAE